MLLCLIKEEVSVIGHLTGPETSLQELSRAVIALEGLEKEVESLGELGKKMAHDLEALSVVGVALFVELELLSYVREGLSHLRADSLSVLKEVDVLGSDIVLELLDVTAMLFHLAFVGGEYLSVLLVEEVHLILDGLPLLLDLLDCLADVESARLLLLFRELNHLDHSLIQDLHSLHQVVGDLDDA